MKMNCSNFVGIRNCFAGLACALSLMPLGCAAAIPLSLTKRSTVNFPAQATDQNNQQFTVGGVSSITFLDPRRGFPTPNAGHTFLAAMDNSNKLVELNLTFSANGSITNVVLVRGISLQESHDNEGISCTNGVRNSVLVSDEDQPGITEYSLSNCQVLSRLPIPPVFSSRRANFGFEALSLQENVRTLYVANEEALGVDGSLSTPQLGTLVRLQRYDMRLGIGSSTSQAVPVLQYAYRTQPIHGAVINGARSGLSDLVALPDRRVLALERSFALASQFFQTRIYELDFRDATDITNTPSLVAASFTPVSKRLLYQGSLNNLEGLCLGPRIGANSWVLLGILDDGDPVTVNQVVSFELKGMAATTVVPPLAEPIP